MDSSNINELYSQYTLPTTSSTTANYNSVSTGYCYTYPWYYTTSVDKGEKALHILKALRDKKIMTLKTIDEFIDAMSLIMKEL